MFSLLLTVISVALVAALAAATLFYGGQAITQSRIKAAATTVIAQGQQMLGATTLFYTERGRWPATAEELVTANYLRTLPHPPQKIAQNAPAADFSLNSQAFADTPDILWAQVQAGAPHFWLLRTVSVEVCKSLNLQVRGDDGIYNAAIPGLPIQCFGTEANYTVLIHAVGTPELGSTVPVQGGTPILQVVPNGGGWSLTPTTVAVTAVNLTPSAVSTDGGETVVVSGSGFLPGTTVAIDGVTVTSTVDNVTTLTLTTPELAPGGHVVTVSVPGHLPVRVATLLTAVPPAPALPAELSFQNTSGDTTTYVECEDTAVGAVSAPVPVVLTNTGESMLVFDTPAFTANGPFSVASTTCTDSLAPGDSCTVSVLFSPLAAQPYSGYALDIHANVAGLTLPLTGTGLVPPALTFEDAGGAALSSVAFPNTAVGTTSAPVPVVLTNSGETPMVFDAPAFVTAAPFDITTNTCGSTLAPGASCTVNVTFTPTSAQTYLVCGCALHVHSNGVDLTLPLSGTGTAPPAMTFQNPDGSALTSVSFPVTPVGSNSEPLPVVLKNTGGVSLVFETPAFSAAAPFSLGTTDCAGTLAPGASCTVNVIFSPAAVQTYPGTGYALTVNASVAGLTLPLSGTGGLAGVAQVVSNPTTDTTFVQKTDGTWVAAGYNETGQLGIRSLANATIFTKILALTGATQVSSGGYTTFARLATGTWVAAGNNSWGQMGLGTTGGTRWEFVAVPALNDAIRVIASTGHTFAQLSNGNWVAAGANHTGQQGDGALWSTKPNFGPIPDLNGVTQLVVGSRHTFAKLASGEWASAGDNAAGQLGLGTGVSYKTRFTVVPQLSGATDVVLGFANTFARLSTGNWVATGYNGHGELGLGSTVNQFLFADVPALNGASQMVAGGYHSFARFPSGNWVAAGYNYSGQLGLNHKTDRHLFEAIPALNGATQVVAGDYHTVARLSTGAWAGVGSNVYGQLGFGSGYYQQGFRSISP